MNVVAKSVIEAFGGPTKAGIALGLPTSTVDSWQRSKGGIPAWRRPGILAAAERDGVRLPREFLESVGDNRKPKRAA
jgi:hypothetical protein